MKTSKFAKTVLIGGGHCGVNLACWLESIAQPYVILERKDQLLWQWKCARWDGFQLNTPHRFSKLYGQDENDGLPADTTGPFFEKQVKLWDDYVAKKNLCRELNFEVLSVKKQTGDPVNRFIIHGTQDGKECTLTASNVVVCTGMYETPKIPVDIANKLPSGMTQMHARDYKNPDQFPSDKAILLVGGGQSGVQIANLLANSGKKVLMCSSAIPGIQRSYRGADIFVWLEKMKFLDMTNEERDERFPPEISQGIKYSKNPQTGGTESISPFSLHRQGVEILGGLKDVTDSSFEILPNRAENVQASLAGSERYRGMFAGFVEKLPNKEDYPDEVPDPAWSDTVPELLEESGRLSVPLDEVQGVIWATGYSADFSWLEIPEAEQDFDSRRKLPGVLSSKAVKGLYYSGFPWVRTGQSGNIVGFNADHEILSKLISEETF